MDAMKKLNDQLYNDVHSLLEYYYVLSEEENGIDFDKLNEYMWKVFQTKTLIKMFKHKQGEKVK